jgi:hypothetical protein
MAVRIAQEDHVFLYHSTDEARQQVLDCGLEIVSERVAPVIMLPFEEADRSKIFKSGNYICVARKQSGSEAFLP